ncbi:MAG: single-stranded DNA-binding protein [Chloroflexi bacterium]|nr:single-stranded DNA-binding protein [Chloroflexota bacterium]
MSLNKCMIIGNLGRDPEMRYTPNGQAVTQFTVATNRRWKGQNEEWQEETEWFRVVVWAQQAERAAERLRKGHKVYIEGRIQTRQWEDQSGQKRYTTELVANQVTSLERRERGEDGEYPPFPGSEGGSPGGGSSGGGSSGGGPSGSDSPAPRSGATASAGTTGSSDPSDAQPAPDYDDLPF